MMDYNDVNFENFYEGGASSLSPDYGNFVGYRMSANQLGFPGSPQTANQLGETVNALKQGVKAFEVTMVQSDMAETIPIQHFKEMRALMKLSGVKPSVHGPLIDAAGFNEKGSWEGDGAREDNERRMFDTLEKAYTLGPEGNIPVVFHSSAGVPGSEWRPGKKELGEERFIMNKGAAINKETGQAIAIKREHKFRPEHPELLEKGRMKGEAAGVLFSAEDSVTSANLGEWENKLTEVAQMNKHAKEIIGAAPLNLEGYKNAVINDKHEIIDVRTKQKLPDFDSKSGQKSSYDQIRNAGLFLENAELSFKGAFHQAYKYGTDDQKTQLKKLAEGYSKEMQNVSEVVETGGGKLGINIWSPIERQRLLEDSLEKLSHITNPHYGGKTPEIFQEAGAFAMNKAATTFGNLAKKSYDDLGGDKSPMLAIEPFHFGGGLSKTEEIIDLVKKSRKNFAKQLVDDRSMNEKEAKEIAEKKIGVTWDVGHINMMKKFGFTDKDVLAATKKITPMVKHVHLTDNFGYADTHLAPGMGNVPIKDILKQLEKNKEFGKMRKIVEAGAFVQHFKKSPFSLTMAAFGSPLYSMKSGPSWNQVVNIQGSYFGGYGTINPSQHHSMYGAGFTTMPVELGGQMPDGQSRFGGTPMA